MNPLLGLVPVALGGAALVAHRHAKRSRESAGSDADPVVGPAYAGLVAAAPEVRRALHEIATELQLSPAALATVIESESGWDPKAPSAKTGTPRGGLIQLTQGARLPGFDTPDKVWAVREMSAEDQLRKVALPFFQRFKGRKPSWTALDIYKRNFLPADVNRPHEFKIGEKGSADLVVPRSKLTRGDVYAANPGFDRGKKGFFTWADVEARVHEVEARAKGKLVTVAGRVLATEDAPAEKPQPAQPDKAAAPAGSVVAPALKRLLEQVNAQWPKRAKASDGTLGDAAHAKRCAEKQGSCDHTLGLAVDITHDPAAGPDLDALAERLLGDPRTTHVIWKGRIANRDIQGGAWRPYTGPNPHTRHLHHSIRESARDDASPWELPEAGAVPKSAAAPPPLPGIVQAWQAGLVDNVAWAEVPVGPYVLRLATDALSIQGIRRPLSFEEVLALCKSAPYLPVSKAIADARWKGAQKRVVLAPLGVPGSKELLAKYPTLDAQAREWSRRIGPKSEALLDGPWKEWIWEPGQQQGRAVNYGLRRADGGVWQSPGHAHDAKHVDWSQLWAPVHREAERDGQAVDIVEELAKGSEALGGTLPGWLREALR